MRPVALALGIALAGAGIVWAQAPTAPPPSCEDRLAATAAYADLLRQVRDQYEQRMAELMARVRQLEAAPPPRPPAKAAPAPGSATP